MDASDLTEGVVVPATTSRERLFPTLSAPHLERIGSYGRRRPVRSGEILLDASAPSGKLFVVLAGRLEIVRAGEASEMLVAELGPGQFTGEISLLSGRRTL